MKKTSLSLLFSVGLLVACTSQQEPPEPPLAQRTELVVLRQSTYSDAAWIDEEEGTYIWLPQTISPFGINLSFNNADGQHKLLDTDGTSIAHTGSNLVWLCRSACQHGLQQPIGQTPYRQCGSLSRSFRCHSQPRVCIWRNPSAE